ncbi:MAG TPA: hypothetical protein VFL85_05520 [Candidatus Saccharimonadales bacterium]|nr:hypothetical protein [Candidatus Saccharimonadales bacterium]
MSLDEAVKKSHREWAIVLILLIASVVLLAVGVVFLLLEWEVAFTYPNLLLWEPFVSAGALLYLVALLLGSYYATRAQVRMQCVLDDAFSRRRRT